MPFFDKYPYTNMHNVNLDWVLQAVKAWGHTVEQNDIAFHNLEQANQDFKDFVTHYLENLDVQDEINNKLDELLSSGALTPYMIPYIVSGVDNWLRDNITPTTPALDATLTLANAAAQAKATGDRIGSVEKKIYNTVGGVPTSFFEIGAVSYTANGWTYGSSTTRIRIKQGTSLHLEKGQRIGLTDYTKARFYVGWVSNGTYGTHSGAHTIDFCCPVTGDYSITVVGIPEESLSGNVSTLADYVIIKPKVAGVSLCSPDLDQDGYFGNDGSPTWTGGGTTVAMRMRRSNFIPVTAGKDYYYEYYAKNTNESETFTPWRAWLFFDDTFTHIGNRVTDTGIAGNVYYSLTDDTIHTINIITPPEGTAYIKLCARTYGFGAFVFIEKDIWSDSLISNAIRENFLNKNVSDVAQHNYYPPEFHSGSQYDFIMKSINHRGFRTGTPYYTQGAPENSLPAFKRSKEQGFNFVETDVQRTSDGVYILSHDAYIVGYDSNGNAVAANSIRLDSVTYAQLMTYQRSIIGEFAGLKYNTLEELLIFCRKVNLHPYIELKVNTLTNSDVPYIIELVKSCGMLKRVTYISGESGLLMTAIEYDRYSRVGYLGQATNDNVAKLLAMDTGYNETFADVQLVNLAGWKATGIPVEVYTLNNEGDINNLDMYVSGVTSDYLVAGKVLLESNMN